MASPIEQSCRHCGLGRRVDGSAVAAIPGVVYPGHDFQIHEQAAAPQVDSPRCAGSVFVLCSLDMVPAGTAFIISPTMVLSAYHCVAAIPEAPTRSHIKKWILAERVERTIAGSLVPIGRTIHVTTCKSSIKPDWVVLKRDEGLFPADKILTICPKSQLPSWQAEVNLKTYHCPVSLFKNLNNGINAIHAVPANVKRTLVTSHRCWTDHGLFCGSSGAPYIISDRGPLFGMVYAMHVQSAKSAESVSDLRYNGMDSTEVTSEVTYSLVQNYDSFGEGVILSGYSNLMTHIA
eukprot:gene25186-30419_t